MGSGKRRPRREPTVRDMARVAANLGMRLQVSYDDPPTRHTKFDIDDCDNKDSDGKCMGHWCHEATR